MGIPTDISREELLKNSEYFECLGNGSGLKGVLRKKVCADRQTTGIHFSAIYPQIPMRCQDCDQGRGVLKEMGEIVDSNLCPECKKRQGKDIYLGLCGFCNRKTATKLKWLKIREEGAEQEDEPVKFKEKPDTDIKSYPSNGLETLYDELRPYLDRLMPPLTRAAYEDIRSISQEAVYLLVHALKQRFPGEIEEV